jgi:hypothetical protein
MNIIPSEDQAERIGERLTGGKRDRDFIVFWYVQKWTNLTLFGVLINGQRTVLA